MCCIVLNIIKLINFFVVCFCYKYVYKYENIKKILKKVCMYINMGTYHVKGAIRVINHMKNWKYLIYVIMNKHNVSIG